MGQFSKTALETRKLDGAHGTRPEWLDDYLREAHEPTAADFDELIVYAEPYEAAYRERYQPIRNKVIAHKDFATTGRSDALFKETNIEELESMLLCLAQIERVIYEWFWNGRRTSPADQPSEKGVGDSSPTGTDIHKVS